MRIFLKKVEILKFFITTETVFFPVNICTRYNINQNFITKILEGLQAPNIPKVVRWRVFSCRWIIFTEEMLIPYVHIWIVYYWCQMSPISAENLHINIKLTKKHRIGLNNLIFWSPLNTFWLVNYKKTFRVTHETIMLIQHLKNPLFSQVHRCCCLCHRRRTYICLLYTSRCV